MASDQIEIALSKKKMILLLLFSLAFVGLGIWFILEPAQISSPLFRNPTVIKVLGFASVALFSATAITVILKLKDKNPGLIIGKEGITDNASGVSAGIIPWNDIKEIKIVQIMNQKFLVIILRNPEDYLDRVYNKWKRKTMEMNFKNYGSPISISANTL